jgi:hypothetical protein
MKIYKLDPNKFSKERNRIIIGITVFSLIMISIVLINLDYENVDHPVIMSCTITAIVSVAIFIGAYKGIKIRRQKWLSYELKFGKNDISLIHEDIKDLEIYFEDIEVICERLNNNIIIRTNEKNKIINIPTALQEFDEIKELLKTIRPIEKKLINH